MLIIRNNAILTDYSKGMRIGVGIMSPNEQILFLKSFNSESNENDQFELEYLTTDLFLL